MYLFIIGPLSYFYIKFYEKITLNHKCQKHFNGSFIFIVNNVGCMYDHPSLFIDVPEKVIIDESFFLTFSNTRLFLCLFSCLNKYNLKNLTSETYL